MGHMKGYAQTTFCTLTFRFEDLNNVNITGMKQAVLVPNITGAIRASNLSCGPRKGAPS